MSDQATATKPPDEGGGDKQFGKQTRASFRDMVTGTKESPVLRPKVVIF